MGHPRHLQRPALDPCAGCVPLIRLVGRRLLGTLPTLLGVLVVAFLLLNVAPGDPVAAMVAASARSPTMAATGSPGATFNRRNATTSTPNSVGSVINTRRPTRRITAVQPVRASSAVR